MIIAHNLMANFTSRELNINTKIKTKSAERLSTGYRINRAADDAAKLSISEKMRSQIRGLERAAQNVQEGTNFCNVAEGALQEIHSILDRIKELSVQATNDTNVSADRAAINDEIAQLKKEINGIARSTEYNTYPIFVTDFRVDFNDDIQVVQIFDANNGDPTDPDSYGGIIVNGTTRVAWMAIDANMVYTDAVTGETKFNEGIYTYNTGTYEMKIECKAESKPPEITVEFPVTAGVDGISIAGNLVEWADILDEDNKSILDGDGSAGMYHFKYGNGEGGFSVPEFDSIQDIIDGINNYNTRYSRKYVNVYDGYYSAQAVDIKDTGSNMRVSNSVYSAIVNQSDLDATLKADTTGIWVVDAMGNAITASKKTWADLGINSWDSGSDISDTINYQYSYIDSDYNIKFNFSLLDETSIDSVIEGINNAKIQDTTITNDTSTALEFTTGQGIIDGVISKEDNELSIYEEAELGRNFDVQNQVLGAENLIYDAATNKFTLTYDGVITSPALEYTSSSLTSPKNMQIDAQIYLNYLTARGVQKELSGAAAVTQPALSDVLGTGKITDSGHLSEIIQINKAAMNTTSDIKNGSYPASKIDFSGLGTDYQWYDLLGTGFNSTCKTCDNHYSVMFVYGNTEKITNEGYGYTLTNDGDNNYFLQIDLKSIVDKGIQTGEQLANAIVDVMRGSKYDFHYTQYASEGSTLYICDNRPSTEPATSADFDTEPYQVSNSVIDIMLEETSGEKSIGLQYTYDMSHSVEAVVNMTADPAGEWIKDGNGYRKFTIADTFNPDGSVRERFNIEITNNISSWSDYYDNVMQEIADNSKIKLSADDYAYVDYYANERDNSATVSTFEFKVYDTNKFWIQGGANANQGIFLEWDNVATYSLGLSFCDTKTRETASELLDKVDKAIEKVSEVRSTFGAYVNRLEAMYNLDTNTAENLQYAESRIRDANMAEEMVEYSKSSILEQAANAMLAQANQMTQGILQLLQ